MKGKPVGAAKRPPNNGQPAQGQQQVEIPITKQVTYTHVNLNVVDDALTVIDPGSATVHIFPLDDNAKRALAGKLVGGLTIPKPGEMPKPGD